jgi:hypothetical protein
MTQHHILKDLNPQQHKREDLIIPFHFGWPKLKSYILQPVFSDLTIMYQLLSLGSIKKDMVK